MMIRGKNKELILTGSDKVSTVSSLSINKQPFSSHPGDIGVIPSRLQVEVVFVTSCRVQMKGFCWSCAHFVFVLNKTKVLTLMILLYC